MNLIKSAKLVSALFFFIDFNILIPPALAQECILTEDGRTICGKPLKSKGSNVNVADFKFTLKGCQIKQPILRCEFTVINTSDTNKRVLLYGHNNLYNYGSKIVTDSGKSIYASEIEFDGKKDFLYRNVNMSPGIEYTAMLTFSNIDNVNKLQLLSIDLSTSLIQVGTSPAIFRNLSLK
jgi:hypothetical protein